MGAMGLGLLAYTFAGFWVYWLVTGQTRVGDGGTVTPIGGLVWLGPIMAFVLIHLVVQDRGPFRTLYLPRSTVKIGNGELAWRTPSGAKRWDWDAIGRVSCLGDGTGQITMVYDPTGVELGSISGALVDQLTRRVTRLPTVIVEVRPDLFQAINPDHPGNGCVRGSAATRSGDPGRSAPSTR
jgi:hypothetical protein